MNIFRASSTLCTGVQLAASVNSPHWRKACSKFRSETPALDGVVPIGKNSATPPPPRPPVLAWTPAPCQRAERAPLAHVAVRVTDVAKKGRKLVLDSYPCNGTAAMLWCFNKNHEVQQRCLRGRR